MDSFESVIIRISQMIWGNALVLVCIGAGIYFSIRLKFVQLRYIGSIKKLILQKKTSNDGISSFQSFVTTVGARVGMGNMAGVSAAIFYGGPGAVFWMWVVAVFGASLAFAESVLAQKYQVVSNGQIYGGPAYYIEKGLHNRMLGVMYAAAVIAGPGILMNGPQIQSIAITFEDTFGMERMYTGVICAVLMAMVIFGGIRRISRMAEALAPAMCMAYLGLIAIVCIIHIEKIPQVLVLIVKSAFGLKPVFGGILGATIVNGVKRGIYSNEAGQGNGAMICAAVKTDRPVEQGLIQSASVYISTMFICTASAMLMLLTTNYNVADGSGGMLVENIPGVEYGILWIKQALVDTYGNCAAVFLSVITVMFVFTTLMTYYYMAEGNVCYLFKKHYKAAIAVMRVLFIASILAGACVSGDAVWGMGDIGAGMMAWINIAAILMLSGEVVEMLRKYEEC